MSALTELKERFNTYSKITREKILGVNNERLEFLMDSFYKLQPSYRNGLLAASVGALVTFVLVAVGIYFVQVSALKQDLNEAFNALNELKVLKQADTIEAARFDSLVDKVLSTNRSSNLKPFFEKLSREEKIPIKSLVDKMPEMDEQNPLAKRLQEVHVELRINKVSIPRLINFLVDIEKSNQFLRVQDLKITGIYGNKLYFDAEILVRGYTANHSS